MGSPQPGCPAEDSGSSSEGPTEAFLELLEVVQAFFKKILSPAAGVPDHLGGGAWCSLPPPPSQFGDMEGVAGGRVGGDLRLEPVDVAAMAEQVAFQWITAVALFVV